MTGNLRDVNIILMLAKFRKIIPLILVLFLIFPFFKLDKAIFSKEKEIFSPQSKYVSNEIIVKFKKDTKPFRVIKIPEGKVGEKIKEYLERDDIEYAEPNYLAYALMTPNDPYYSYQWHFDNSLYGGIHMKEAWDVSAGEGVTVAVVDSGIRKGSDLANTCFAAGYDFVGKDNDPTDENGHGTHVAGTIAQSTNNNTGVAGVAYKSCLMAVRVLDANGSGTYADVASGIRWAADHGAKVINLSLGGEAESSTLKEAVAYAYEKGATVVAACGNDNKATCLYPAVYDDYVIAVGATQYDETKAPYSNYGLSLDLVAPGGNLNIDQNGDGYGDGVLQQTFTKKRTKINWGYYFYQGTSMAAPHVSGAAALLISAGRASAPDGVRTILQQTAEDKGTPGRDDIYGWGLVDAAAALSAAVPTPTFTPTPTANPTAIPTATPTPTPEFTPTPTVSSTPTPTVTPTPTPGEKVLCWSGSNKYLYRNNSQAKKFCKCAQGTYGYSSYKYSWERQTVYYFMDSQDNENWEVISRSSYLPVSSVTCTDGIAYPTNQDYFFQN